MYAMQQNWAFDGLDPWLALDVQGSTLAVTSSRSAAPLRGEMECFVRSGFSARFGADITRFMPELLGAFDAQGGLVAVIGMRPAAAETLFLEQYLEVPIERRLSDHLGETIERGRILEAGNLVAQPRRFAAPFFQAFLVWVTTHGPSEWLVFTGTRSVRSMLRRLGATLFELEDARPSRLEDAADAWGSYYLHEPRVTALELRTLLPLLDTRLFDPAQLRRWISAGLQVRS